MRKSPTCLQATVALALCAGLCTSVSAGVPPGAPGAQARRDLEMPSDTAAEGGLWGEKNLIADPRIEVGDTVTIVISPAVQAEESREDAPATARAQRQDIRIASDNVPAQTATARVVKTLPDGSFVLEAKVTLGRGYILIGGRADRACLSAGQVGADRAVDITRVANLAIVARGLDADVLARFVRSLARCGPGTGGCRFASGDPVGR
jgi:hypothetical protein